MKHSHILRPSRNAAPASGRKLFLRVLFVAMACCSHPLFHGRAEDSPSASAGQIQTGAATKSEQGRLDAVIANAKKHDLDTLDQYARWLDSVDKDERKAAFAAVKRRDDKDFAILTHIHALSRTVRDSEKYAVEALANPHYNRNHFPDLIKKTIAGEDPALPASFAGEAIERIGKAWKDADSLVKTRDTLFARYQEEVRRGKINAGTRLAWGLIRIGAAGPDFRITPGSFEYDETRAAIALTYQDSDIAVSVTEDDYQKRVQATVDGYRFTTGWATLFQKPLGWMAAVAKEMRAAGVSPDYVEKWTVMEAPEGLIALSATSGKRWDTPLRAFYKGEIRTVRAVPEPQDAGRMIAGFRAAAEALHDGVMGDASIPHPLRQALKPVLAGTFRPVDPRDYFDGDFCRRLIEADYLESQVPALSAARKAELAVYRETLAKVEAGLDRFAVELGDDGRLVAIAQPEIDVKAGEDADTYRDSETGETVSPYQWRWERADSTIFHSPMPARYLHAMSVLQRYGGRHLTRPVGAPASTEVWHAVLGRLASYRDGAAAATGDAAKWFDAVVMDTMGRKDTTAGPLGWNFPLFVPVTDDQGDPLLIATLNGVVAGPDFGGIPDEKTRREAQDKWLAHTAEVLASPGELSLLFQVFFRYCSDSPLPEMPNLIGSHYGLSDTHQTVYQSLDRRWVGRLIGDCDDLAEFFQNLCVRQGKLCHVMQLPAHAAAGYLDALPDGGYEFVVLQTGPVLRFTAETRLAAVEKGYSHFDEPGESHFTSAAVPLLLRFANEDTRTPFVLPARIYWDRVYAEQMIEVQGYWHLHTFASAIGIMEGVLKDDREIGNIKELASLYEQVGRYDDSAALRQQELDAVQNDALARLSTLMDIAGLHIKDKNKEKAMRALSQMEDMFLDWSVTDSAQYARTTSFRYYWATLLARLDEPARAWKLLRLDATTAAEKGDGSFSDPLLRTLVTLYARMAQHRDAELSGPPLDAAETAMRVDLRGFLERAFGKGYFRNSDSNNKIFSRYYWLGRYAVAVAGRRAGLDSLCQDGPYPAGPRQHSERGEELVEADWEWFRIIPRLYLTFALEMLDREEYPELYDPEAAEQCLRLVERAVDKGAGLGSDVMGDEVTVKSNLLLSFLHRDLSAFREVMTLVRGKDYSSLYDDAAVVFGTYGGLVPAAEFPEWIAAFHGFFPGRQHYFKAAYRAMSKGHYDHAILLARATAGYFPDDALLAREADALEESATSLRRQQDERGWNDPDWASRKKSPVPATSYLNLLDIPIPGTP